MSPSPAERIGAWRIEDGVLIGTPDATGTAVFRTAQKYGDCEIRLRLECSEAVWWAEVNVRRGGGDSYRVLFKTPSALAGLKGKAHVLHFRCAGDEVTATQDGQPLAVERRGTPPRDGQVRLWVNGGSVRVHALEWRPL